MTGNNSTVRLIHFIPGIAWFLFGLLLICMPGKEVQDNLSWLDIVHFDKLVHAILFGGIVWLFCMPYKKYNMPVSYKLHQFIKITLATITWGLTTEYIQKFFITGRQFDWIDWIADSAGAVIAWMISRKLFI